MRSLFRRLVLATMVMCTVLVTDAGAQTNPSPSGDPFIGRYEGHYTPTGRAGLETVAEVISHGRGLYRLKVDQHPGVHLELYGVAAGPALRINGYSNNISWTGTVEEGALKLGRTDAHYGGTFALNKVIQHSDTEGLKPPKDAVVLLALNEGKGDLGGWTNSKWESLDGGVMRVKGGSGDNRTQAKHGSIRLHLEFKTAHMPSASGQQRSNSGLYFQDRYEVQVLDSFGVIPGSGDCGGIYEQSVPAVNASYPPGQWQTYDIEFTAPVLDKDGKVEQFPTVTVVLNGVTVQDKHEFKTVTGGAINDQVVQEASLRLQDHSDPVEYRNIWWVATK